VQSQRQQIIEPKAEFPDSINNRGKLYNIDRVVNDNNIYQKRNSVSNYKRRDGDENVSIFRGPCLDVYKHVFSFNFQ